MAYTIANEIRIGPQSNPTYRWWNDKIVLAPRGVFTVDVLGNELTIDQFTATVRWNVDAPLVYNPVGTPQAYKTRNGGIYLLKKPANYGQKFLTDIAPSTPVYWYVGGSVYAKGYFKSVERIGRYLYKITCESGIGLLSAKTHVGGLYTGQTVTALLSSIIGNTFTYSVDQDVGAVTVYGHLKYTTARANLHDLLFAIGAVLTKDSNGNYKVVFLGNTMTNVPTSRVALSGKTEYKTPADSVEVTEHSFFALNSDETVQLFDNSNGSAVSNQLVIFDQPMHDLAVTGNLTISESSVNHAVVSGVGSLTGKQYTHNALIIKEGSTSNNVKRVTSNELISFANSYYVARRVYSYFASTKTINAKILLENEKPGQLLALRDSFGDATNAYLSQMDVSATTVKLANCKLVAGFQPGANGNNFTRRALITANATWTVPSGVTRIRIVLIGGGQGGQGGYDGAHGLDTTTTPGLTGVSEHQGGWRHGIIYANGEQPAAQGGAPGQPGAKAAFLVSDKVVSAGNTISIVVGVGGNGGARNGELGEVGTPTTASGSAIGTLSSDDGVATYEGYNDPVSGITYAIDGISGERGGDGGLVGTPYGWQAVAAERGESIKTWSGGAGGQQGYFEEVLGPRETVLESWEASPGGGGGAAVGRNGSNGTNASKVDSSYEWRGQWILEWTLTGGNGGNGADAVAPTQPTIYGQGGAGGNGGGGGGNAGGLVYYIIDNYASRTTVYHAGDGGLGGQGSAGSKGANGCAIIYY